MRDTAFSYIYIYGLVSDDCLQTKKANYTGQNKPLGDFSQSFKVVDIAIQSQVNPLTRRFTCWGSERGQWGRSSSKRSEKEGMGQRAEGRNMKKSATSEIQVVNTTNFPMWEPLTMVFTRLAAGQTA